jgi:nucleoside 2-deoxyribosyltransferase
MKKSIYLAGPISGQTYEGCTDWRQYVMDALPEFDCFSPMRCKDYLLEETTIEDDYSEHFMSTQRAILARDYNDCRTCDAILVNLLGATERVSIGTVMEIAFAHAHRVPVMLVMEKSGNIHSHCMLREACPLWTDNLDEALQYLKALLLTASHVKKD